MRNTSGVPTLSDTDLDAHIEDLESQLSKLHINLQLATEEKLRREQRGTKSMTKLSNLSPTVVNSQSDATHSILRLGDTVRIRNRYRGNKGKIGKVIQLSSKTATVYIANEGNFIKYLHNLELISRSEHEE